jgi:hypothetical protein
MILRDNETALSNGRRAWARLVRTGATSSDLDDSEVGSMFANKFVFAASLLIVSAPAMGQALYQDIQREFADENQLQRDFRRYQQDISTGHYLRAAADRARIQNDEAHIRFDQAAVQNDLSYQGAGYSGQSLVAHPQYPGYYYYPSQPGQLYYYQTQQPAPAQASFVGPPAPATYIGSPGQGPVPATYVGPPGQGASSNLGPVGMASANPVTFNVAPPLRTITVFIANPADTGVPINFAIDGTAYNVPSGYTQRLNGTSSSIIEFDRGELFGDGRYTLSDGSYEFRYTNEKGWELYKRPVKPPIPSTTSTSALPRNVPPRSVASTSPFAVPAATTTSPAPLPTPSTSDVIPPPPIPDPSTPR